MDLMTKIRIPIYHTIELIKSIHRVLMYNHNLISDFPHRYITNTCQIMTMVMTMMMTMVMTAMMMMMMKMMSKDDDNDGDKDKKMRHCKKYNIYIK